MSLAFLWYLVVFVAMVMYAILDGFDLGVGAIYLFLKSDHDRRIALNAIGPVWDGNEVWLVIVLGAVFAGFTPLYATFLSGFYTPTMMLICCMIFRAVAIEFRSKRPAASWRSFWDWIFCFASIFMGFLFGCALGNLILGLPLDKNFQFQGDVALFFRPFAALVGLCAIALFAMHGAIYLDMKTEGVLQKKVQYIARQAIAIFVVLYLITSILTFNQAPYMVAPFFTMPAISVFPVLALGAIANIPYQMKKKRGGWAFLASCIAVALLLALFGLGTYPYLIRSTVALENSLTIENSASSEKTLSILLTITAIGIPLVFAYGYWVYQVFRGKVRLTKQSY